MKKFNLRERLEHQFRGIKSEYASDSISYDDEREIEAKDIIESKVERVYRILSGQGPRAWWKRANKIDKIISGGSGYGLINDIENALVEGSITKEYASMTTNYIKDLMRESMLENRSFRRALQGSEWEKTAKENIGIIDMMIDEYGLTEPLQLNNYELKYGLERGLFKENAEEPRIEAAVAPEPVPVPGQNVIKAPVPARRKWSYRGVAASLFLGFQTFWQILLKGEG